MGQAGKGQSTVDEVLGVGWGCLGIWVLGWGGEIDFEAEVKCAFLAKLPTRNFFLPL